MLLQLVTVLSIIIIIIIIIIILSSDQAPKSNRNTFRVYSQVLLLVFFNIVILCGNYSFVSASFPWKYSTPGINKV